MKIFSTKVDKVTEKVIEVNKGIGALTFRTQKNLNALNSEKINIQIQRSNGDNIEITNGKVPLKDFLVLGTMNENAIGCDPINELAVKATIALVEHEMCSIHLHEKDLLRIEFTGLDVTQIYELDGHEAPLSTDDIYSYQRKSMNSEHENMDFDVAGYDCAIITDDQTINEINLKFDNGAVVKTTPAELRDLQESVDPIAQVNLDGTVLASFEDFIQIPLKGILSINIRKEQGEIINLLMRHDVDITNL